MSEQKDLVTIEFEEGQTALEVFSSEDTVEPYLQLIRDKVAEFPLDLATKKSRKEIASLARKVASMKTQLDARAADEKKKIEATISEQKTKISAIDATRKYIKQELDKLRDDTKRPLLDWEAAEEKRVSEIRQKINTFKYDEGDIVELSSEQLKKIEEKLISIEMDENFKENPFDQYQEFGDEAMSALDFSLQIVQRQYQVKLKEEEQEAEIARLKKEAEEREKKQEEERLAAMAAAEERRKAEAEKERLRIQAEQEEERRKKAEQDAIEAQEALRKQQAEADEKAKARAAELAERARLQKEEEEKERKANQEHQARIHRDIQSDIVEHTGLDNDQAFEVITALYYGKIRYVKVRY